MTTFGYDADSNLKTVTIGNASALGIGGSTLRGDPK